MFFPGRNGNHSGCCPELLIGYLICLLQQPFQDNTDSIVVAVVIKNRQDTKVIHFLQTLGNFKFFAAQDSIVTDAGPSQGYAL